MTFKGMLTIMVNDFKKQHEQKLFSIANELMRTRRELTEVKEQLRTFQLGPTPPPSDVLEPPPSTTISLFIQHNGFFNELWEICQSMTVRDLLTKLRHITGMTLEHPIRLRVLSEDGSKTLFFLDKELDRTLQSYSDQLKPRMILSIEENENDEDTTNYKRSAYQRSKSMSNSERTHSYESDV